MTQPPLYQNQQDIISIASKHARFAFWSAPGTGKTRSLLHALTHHNLPLPALILCPLSITKAAWLEDAQAFGYDKDRDFTLGTGQRPYRTFARKLISQGKSDALIMNYESFREDGDHWLKAPPRTIILDESTKIKAPTSKISKLCRRLSHKVQNLYLLSGLPTPHSLMDLWSQMYCISPDILGPTFNGFRTKYFYQPQPKKHSWLWVTKSQAHEDITARCAPYSRVYHKEDCTDLPEQTYLRRYIRLSTLEMSAYRAFIRDLILQLDTGAITASNAAVELAKCRQMAAGGIIDSEGTWTPLTPSPSKTRDLLDVSEQLGDKPMLILGAYRGEIEHIAEALNKRYGSATILYGGLTAAKRDWAIRGFKDGTYRFMVAHPAAMAHGLTFTHCSDTYWHSLPFDYEHWYQANQRTHRIGQHWPCTYYAPTAEDTVDKRVLRSMLDKHSMSAGVLDDIVRQGA